MKTANTIFPTGLAAMDTKHYFDGDIMYYNGRWYRIGEGHKAFNPDKTADEDFYILTLASIAAELRTKDITEANIYLAIGLPTTWTVRQRNAYREYIRVVRSFSLPRNTTHQNDGKPLQQSSL